MALAVALATHSGCSASGASDRGTSVEAPREGGTAHGAREYSVSTVVPFERATSYPQQVQRIEYDTYANLVAGGVIRPAWRPDRQPRPFPGAGYVPDPPAWP